MARVGRYVRITGQVQGVFFRQWTVDQARALGVAGWVRNCPDGAVEARLSGEEAAVEQLVERLRAGPPHARVDQMEVNEIPAEGGNGFEVRH